MRTDDFEYHLPPGQIAQTPAEPRDTSRLLVLSRADDTLSHDRFFNLGRYLRPGDLLVANQSRVLPARLFGRKATGGKIELLLLRRQDSLTWEALVGGRGVRPGMELVIVGHELPAASDIRAEVLDVLPHGGRLVRFNQPIEPALPAVGTMPLPPYITTQLQDQERYQTVYSTQEGSAAAPTAGLHFTRALLDQLKAYGIGWTTVTLHVGLDTFRPVQVDDPAQHQMHSEWFELGAEAAAAINTAQAEGRRVIAVGTTTVRVLETVAQRAETAGSAALVPWAGDTRIFIYPPYRFRVVDGLITNFHLPKSTLMMLVSALAGRERILAAYAEAVRAGYRFFSFGDAMLIM